MHRLAVGALAGLALCATACLRENVQYCNNGAYCPEPLVCTERTEAPFCGNAEEVMACLGKADEDACAFEGDKNGYCNQGKCVACDPNLSFCRYAQWTAMTPVIDGLPVMTDLSSVWAAGPTDVFIVGKTGTVIHWNGRAWSRVASVSADADYEAIWGVAATEVYAGTVGNIGGTRLFRFDGAAWAPQTPPPAGIMNALWGVPGRVFAVGTNGEIGRNDGTWSYSTPTTFTLNGVWGTGADSAVAVGNAGTAMRFDTNAWTPESTGTNHLLRDVAGAGGVEFAVGRAAVKAPVVLRRQAMTWTDVTAMLPAIGAIDLHGVWVVSPTDVYAVGENGTILHFDGVAWTVMPTGVATMLTEIFGTTTDLFAVGASGTVLRLSR